MDIALRAIVLFAFLVLVTRVIGRRELSSLSPFDLILLIVLGDAVQRGLTLQTRVPRCASRRAKLASGNGKSAERGLAAREPCRAQSRLPSKGG